MSSMLEVDLESSMEELKRMQEIALSCLNGTELISCGEFEEKYLRDEEVASKAIRS